MGFRSWLSGTSLAKFIVAPFSWTSISHQGLNGELVTAYFTGVKIISENFAKMHPQVKDANNKVIKDHSLNKVFMAQPNKYLNRQKFWKIKESNRMNKGDSYSYVERDTNGKVVGLHLLTNESVSKAVMSERGTLYYAVDFDKSPMIPFTGAKNVRAEDIIHMSFGQTAGLFGISALDVLQLHTNVLSKAMQTLDSFYTNNATSALAIETTVDRASLAIKFNESADDFIEKYTGSENAGKPIKLPPNTKLTPIGQKFADAQLIETQKYAREEIANLFGIPKSMFEATDNNESIEQQTRMFLAMAMTPILEAYIAELEFKLLTDDEKKNGIHIEFNTEKLIETDIKTMAEIVTMQVTKGIMTPNEGAIKMGNNPIDSKFGDLHWTQTQNKPIEYYDQWEEDKTINSNTDNEAGDNKPSGDKDLQK